MKEYFRKQHLKTFCGFYTFFFCLGLFSTYLALAGYLFQVSFFDIPESIGIFLWPLLAMIMWVYLIVLGWRFARGWLYADVQKFCNRQENPEAMMEHLEEMLYVGYRTKKHCFFDEEYFVLHSPLQAEVILLNDVEKTTGFPRGLHIRPADIVFHFKNGKRRTVGLHRGEPEVICEILAEIRPDLEIEVK